MKTKLTLSIFLLSTFCFLFSQPGCTTTPNGGTTINTNVAQKLSGVLTVAVSGAVVYGYSQNPATIKYLDAVKTCLYEFLEADNLSAANLQAKIAALPINELHTAEAQLIITPLIMSYRAFGQELVRNGYQENLGLRILVKALIDGLNEGIIACKRIECPGCFVTVTNAP